jgi:hypothetical protein
MKKIKLKFWLSLTALVFLFASNSESQQILHGHVPAVITKLGLQPTGRLDSNFGKYKNIITSYYRCLDPPSAGSTQVGIFLKCVVRQTYPEQLDQPG